MARVRDMGLGSETRTFAGGFGKQDEDGVGMVLGARLVLVFLGLILRRGVPQNYSKWDNIVCSSDDDEDCHPNIDKKLWRRLMKEKRERKAYEEEQRKQLLEKENAADEKAIAELESKLKNGADKKETEGKIAGLKGKMKKRNRELLAIFRRKKYTPEEMCHVTDERTIVNSEKAIPKDVKNMEYEEYSEKFEKKLETYSKLRTESLSQGFLIKVCCSM
eukprot:1293935-Amorphochlora_amoeboformis.AAC.1